MNVTFGPAVLANTAADDMRKRECVCVYVYAVLVLAVDVCA